MKLMLLNFVLFSISQNTFYAQGAHTVCGECSLDNNSAARNFECPVDRNNKTLCSVANTNRTILECHASRFTCENDNRQHWTSVCLFLPCDNIRQDFLQNYGNYDCQVMGRSGCVNCTSRLNPRLSFVNNCNFIVYFCEVDPINCLSRFPSVLEEGGRCPQSVNCGPSPDLFSLTHSFLCHRSNRTLPGLDYSHLKRLEIRLPGHCNDHSAAMYGIFLWAVMVLLIAVVGTVLLCKYRKLKAGVLTTMEGDDVIKMGDTMNEDMQRFLELHQKTDSRETVDLFIPKPDASPKTHPSPSDFGFMETFSHDVLSRTEDFNFKSQATLTNSNSVAFFNNPNGKQHQYKITKLRESDEETADYELRTYSIKPKINDSNLNLVVNIPASSKEKDLKSTVANDHEVKTEDEENVEYELRTYSLTKKLNPSNTQLDVIPSSSPEIQTLLRDTSCPQKKDQNLDFLGYLEKNESDEFPCLSANFIPDAVDFTDSSNNTTNDSMPIKFSSVQK